MNPGGPTERELKRQLRKIDQLADAPKRTSKAVDGLAKPIVSTSTKNSLAPTAVARGRSTQLMGRQIAQGGLPGLQPTNSGSLPKPIRSVHAPTTQKVRPAVLYRALAFDLNGESQAKALSDNPVAGVSVNNAAVEAKDSTFALFGRRTRAHNNAADAFRHAVWSYRMTVLVGPHLAKKFGDAHEVSSPTPNGARLMDLYNNNVGRRLAIDPANQNRNPDDVILEALQAGKLQVRPFRTR